MARPRISWSYYFCGGTWWRARSQEYSRVHEIIPNKRVPSCIRKLHGASVHLWRYSIVGNEIWRSCWEGWTISKFDVVTLEVCGGDLKETG